MWIKYRNSYYNIDNASKMTKSQFGLEIVFPDIGVGIEPQETELIDKILNYIESKLIV